MYGVNYFYKGRLLRNSSNNKGYQNVAFSKNCIQKTMKVHKLVAEAFIENIENKPTVNHIDGNKANNNLENLEWATYKEQTIHAKINNLIQEDLNGKKIFCKELNVIKPSIKKMGVYLYEIGIVKSWTTGQTGVSKALKYNRKFKGLTFIVMNSDLN